jgi:hypothetical protein
MARFIQGKLFIDTNNHTSKRSWPSVGTILIRDQLAMCGNPDHKRYTTSINTISYAIFTRHFLLELHIKGWQTFNINLYFTNVSYQYYISANDLLLVWLFVSINSLPWIYLAIILLPTYRMVLDFPTTRTKHDKTHGHVSIISMIPTHGQVVSYKYGSNTWPCVYYRYDPHTWPGGLI